MHVEISIALNFLITFLYNKLPRRRVNQFGEELEQALKAKFAGHWYPDQPAKGSAYRCIKTANPLDPVFEIAARNCGLELSDIQEYLPNLTVWVEPGEVSYRMSEKSPVKLLYQENENGLDTKRVQSFNASSEQVFTKENNDLTFNNLNNSSTTNTNTNLCSSNTNVEQDLISNNGNGSPGSNSSSNSSSVDSGFNDVELQQQQRKKVLAFNPQAQCFKPIESSTLISSFTNNQTTNQYSNGSMLVNNYSFSIQNANSSGLGNGLSHSFNQTNYSNTNASNYFNNSNVLKSPNQQPSILPTTAGFPKQPQTMTTAQFAQTKFGSTKLKTTNNSTSGAICGINGTTKQRNSYSNRMSPTEFSNYIKQRALLQQQQGMNTLSQSLNGGHQLQVPLNGNSFNSANNNGNNGFNLFNSLSPQQSRSISPISNQDNFLLMAAAAAAVSNSNQTSSQVANNLMRNQITGNNSTPISATTNGIHSNLNSTGNSICSSLNSNSGAPSLKLMLNNPNTITSQNLLSPSSNSAPSGDNLLSNISYLSELFNNTSLSPILGTSASPSTQNCNVNSMANGLNSSLNSSLNTNSLSSTMSCKPSVTENLNRFQTTPTSFLEMNTFGSFSSTTTVNSDLQTGNNKNLVIGSKGNESQFNQSNQLDINNNQMTANEANQAKNLPQANQPNQQQQSNPANQNSPKSNGGNQNDKQFDSYSMNNGIYPNQYQHLLVAN